MNLKEVIAALEELRVQCGDDIPVVVCGVAEVAGNASEVDTVRHGKQYFFNATEGFFGTQVCISLHP